MPDPTIDPAGAKEFETPPTPAPAAKAVSQLDRLKERRRRAREEREPLDLDIPGYGGELVARYRVLSFEEMEKLQDRGGKMARAADIEVELKITMDTIAAACVGIFLREDGKLRPLNEVDAKFGDEPVRYDERLAEAVGVDSEGKVRILIRRMFPTELSIIGHLQRVSNWMSGVNDADDEDF
jgi:hypothetical protein